MLTRSNRMRFVGGLFLGVALYQFLSGDPWIVWLILGALLGGFSFFGKREGPGEQ